MAWVWLYVAIVLEVGATITLRFSNGLTDMRWSSVSLVLFLASLGALGKALGALPIGVVYAIWSGLGTALIVTFGVVYDRDPLSPIRILLIFMIIAGAVGLNMATSTRS